MKATGVVRRIDDLGRIVIPKEIRRTLKVNEGDNLEIYVNNDEIILKKYSVVGDITDLASKLVSVFYKNYNKSLLITDRERVIAVSKNIEKTYNSLELTNIIKDSINNRNEVVFDDSNVVVGGKKENKFLLIPIITNSDAIGSIILIDEDIDDNLKSVIRLLVSILIKNVEE